MEELPDYLKGAYKIFVDEFSGHLEFFSSLNLDKNSYVELSEEISRRFHTIKGGAGFLMQKEIEEAAFIGEQLFKEEFNPEINEKFLKILSSLKKSKETL